MRSSRFVIAPIFAALCLGLAGLDVACSTADLKTPVPSETPADPGSGDPNGDGEDGGGAAGEGGLLPDGGAAPPPVTSDVTIQVQPSDNGFALLNAIKAAKKSVHMEIYLLSSTEIIDALVALKKAGKDVKVVLNKDFPPNGGSNTSSYDTLKSNGVNVVYAPSAYQFTHAKTIVIDGAKLIVMTMNLTYTSAQTNREYIATDTDPDDVADAEKVFDADFRNVTLYLPNTKLVVSPDTATPVNPRTRLLGLIQSATKSLDVEVQSLSDDTLVDAIVKAHESNIAVRVVLDKDTLNSDGQEAALAKLKSNGVPLKAVSTPDIHAKAIVVDGARAFIGSQNMTPTALFANREMGVVTDAASEIAKITKAISDDYAKGVSP